MSAGTFQEHRKDRRTCILRSFYSGLRLDLRPALGAGNHNFPLARGNPADGLAALAGKILVLLVGVAGPGPGAAVFYAAVPVYPTLILHPPPGEILGKRAEQNHNHQKEQHALQRPDGQPLFEEDLPTRRMITG